MRWSHADPCPWDRRTEQRDGCLGDGSLCPIKLPAGVLIESSPAGVAQEETMRTEGCLRRRRWVRQLFQEEKMGPKAL